MKTLQEYKNRYYEIANELGIKGDSVEVLVGLLANASYISEVENAVYMREASLTKATLMNSKIQKCMDQMYSVYRGTCPRVIMHVEITDEMRSTNKYDEIVSSNNFKIYFESAWDKTKEAEEEQEYEVDKKTLPILENFTIESLQQAEVGSDMYICGILAPSVVTEDFNFANSGDFYHQTSAQAVNLSADMYLRKRSSGSDANYPDPEFTTRTFGEHVKDKKVFDLTTTSFGSRLYFNTPDYNAVDYRANYFVYSTLGDYNSAEIRKIKWQGTRILSIGEDDRWRQRRGDISVEEGRLVLLEASGRDSLDKIHYQASKQRYTNQVIRTNNDIEELVMHEFPKKVLGSTYRFISTPTSCILNIYYIPGQSKLTPEEVDQFKADNKAYFVTDNININPGEKYTATFGINLVVYKDQSESGINEEVESILGQYKNKFGVDFDVVEEEIKSSISKISAVRSIKDYNIQYTKFGTIAEKPDPNAATPPYFDIKINLNIVKS